MARGEAVQTKVHYKGKDDDYIVIVESADAVKDWKKDSSIPLAQVVASFDVFVTGGHGVQGVLNRASKSQLENEFGAKNDEDAVKQILEKGTVQEQHGPSRQGETNPNNGPGAGNIQ